MSDFNNIPRKEKRSVPVLNPTRKVIIQHPEPSDDLSNSVLDLTHGIYLMEEWWKKQDIFVNYHITDYNQYHLEVIPELSKLVMRFHQIIAPHQRLEGKDLVFGLGASQLLQAAFYAFSIIHAKPLETDAKYLSLTPLYYTHQVPGYLDTKEVIESFDEFNAHWIDFAFHQHIPDEDLVEIITCPNNPNSKLLKNATNARYIIHDRVNLWPFFMTKSLDSFYSERLDHDELSIFSLPKILSFSGSRVGYAFVRQRKIAQLMRYYIMIDTHGLSGDGQIRCLTALRYLIENNKAEEYVEWITQVFKERWERLDKVLANSEMRLLNHQGSGVWLKTPTKAREYLYDKYKIIATYGPEYGADDYYGRLNLQCTSDQFEELILRLAEG